jgi:tripartite-type tricarboxylate transporter receptor subunit TctC
VGEFVPGYESSAWWGVGVPRNTPVGIIDKLNKEINAGLADPKLKARLADLGTTVLRGSSAEFGKFIAANTDAAEMLRAMRAFLKENDMMAYLVMMAVRLLELHRVA